MKQCTLELKDEVNCRFVGLDVDTRRKLVKEFEYFLPHAKHTPAFKLGRWNGMINYCDVGGRTYINLLDRALLIVAEAGYGIEVDDLRQPHSFEFTKVDKDSYAHIKWPTGHPLAGKSIELRDYQVDLINDYLTDVQCVNIAPTAAGKTIVTAVLAHKTEVYGRSIVIVPTKDLVTQTEEDFINMGLDVGVYFGDRKDYNKTHTICTWQSLEVMNKLKDGTIEEFTDGVSCVMVDECFAEDTPVLTPDGYKPIQTLEAGDTVINYSETDQAFKEDTVVKLHTNLQHTATEKMYELAMDNGTVIKVTGNHKFLTSNRGWVRADELDKNDNIIELT